MLSQEPCITFLKTIKVQKKVQSNQSLILLNLRDYQETLTNPRQIAEQAERDYGRLQESYTISDI